MKRKIILFSIVFTIFILLNNFGCKNDDFSPVGDFEPRLVVYSILDNINDLHYIKIQQSYAIGHKSTNYDELVKKTKVSIRESNGTYYYLRDTILRENDNYCIFYFNKPSLTRTGYQLFVESELYPRLNSYTLIPAQQVITVTKSSPGFKVVFLMITGAAFTYHMFIRYQVSPEIEKNEYIEVPRDFQIIDGDSILIFPKILKSFEVKDYIQYDPTLNRIVSLYKNENIIYTLRSIKKNNNSNNMKITECFILAYAFDKNLWTYIESLKGFEDPYSIRLDDVFWSNIGSSFSDISKAVGVFGSYTIDTTLFQLPHEMIDAFGFIDGQQ